MSGVLYWLLELHVHMGNYDQVNTHTGLPCFETGEINFLIMKIEWQQGKQMMLTKFELGKAFVRACLIGV